MFSISIAGIGTTSASLAMESCSILEASGDDWSEVAKFYTAEMPALKVCFICA